MSIGLDIECVNSFSEELWPQALTHNELRALSAAAAAERTLIAALIFSAKGCLFKCQCPVNEQWIEFNGVEITVDSGADCFTAVLCEDIGRLQRGTRARGRYLIHDGYVCTGMCWPEGILKPSG